MRFFMGFPFTFFLHLKSERDFLNYLSAFCFLSSYVKHQKAKPPLNVFVLCTPKCNPVRNAWHGT